MNEIRYAIDEHFPVVLVWLENPDQQAHKIEHDANELAKSLFASIGNSVRNKHIAFNVQGEEWVTIKQVEPNRFDFTHSFTVSNEQSNSSLAVASLAYLSSCKTVGGMH